MNKPLICTTILMSAALVAEVKPGDTLWTICGEIAADKEDLRRLVWQAKKDNRIKDVGNLQRGMLIVVRVEEARNQ